MLYESFKELEQLDNVKNIGSATNRNPLHDESVTIFLKNGYRVISTKSIFGQTLEVENMADPKMPVYKSEVYHQFMNNLPLPENKFYQEEEGNIQQMSADAFSSKINTIIGEAIYNYLSERHKSVAILTVYPDKASTPKISM